MKVFIAGASGAVGIPIVKELIKQGHAVAAMTRSERGTQRLQTLGAKVIVSRAAFVKDPLDADIGLLLDRRLACPFVAQGTS